MTQIQDITATVHELDGATLRLQIDQAHGYVITSWDDGWQWVTETVESRKMDGDAEINRRKGAATIQIGLYCQGTSNPTAAGLAQALKTALWSSPFLLTKTSGGVSETWRCRVADITPRTTTDDWLNHRKGLAISIPASPNTTTTGVILP